MKRIITILTFFTLVISACGTAQNTSPTQLPEATQVIATAVTTTNTTSSNAITPTASEEASALQLAIGTLKLDDTSEAVTASQAAKLLPLWTTLKNLESQAHPHPQQQGGVQTPVALGNDTAAQQQIAAQVKLIEDAMTSKQMQAIANIQITNDNMKDILQGLGISMTQGASPAGGMPGGNAGNGMGPSQGSAPQGTPPTGGMPGGNAGNGMGPGQGPTTMGTPQTGMGPGGGFIPTELIDAVIQYLTKKAG